MEQDKEKIELKKIEELSELKDKEVLEIGCGDGRISSLLVKKVKKLTAIDPDEESIKKAKLKIKDVDFRVGSGENLDFENKSFDTVIFTFSLHHQNSKKALEEAHGVLRKNGQLLIIEPAPDGEVQQFFHLFEDETQELKNAQEAIEKGSFELKNKETFFTGWVFKHKEELYNYYFYYYNKKKDNKLIEKMNELLGEKRNSQPIILKDTVSIFSLRKK